MTLFKQMGITLSLFLALILVAVMVLNFKTATTFVQDQLYTNAQNTAHSLGLSLSKISDPSDHASIETMINAIYDSGYYERIALVDVQQKPLYVRETDVFISDVPQWFINAVTIENAHASSDIMMGWSRFGTLEVSGHTGNAYRQLYHAFRDLVQTFVLIGVVVLLALHLLLKLSLHSLKQIREQARGIIENRFIIETKMPFSTEFRSATVAMNAMVHKVKDIFERENETLVCYQGLLYKDTETPLYNRRYLTSKLPEFLKGDATLSQGVFVLLSIDELDRFKKEHGYEQYTAFIHILVQGLETCARPYAHALCIRLNENDFFLLLPLGDTEGIKAQMETLLKELHAALSMDALAYLFVGVGMGIYGDHDTQQSILSRADYSVAQAKQGEDFTCILETQHPYALTLSRDEWRAELTEALKNSRFILAAQDVMRIEKEASSIVHQEMFIRLKRADGTIYSAGVFMPMAATLGLVDEIDRGMIRLVLKHIAHEKGEHPVAINLGADFVKKHSNIQWLKEELGAFTGSKRLMLWFEVTNAIALHNLEAIISLGSTLKMLGYRFGIDSFTIPQEGAYYLQAIRPDYVKCNVAYLKDMMLDTSTGNKQESLNNLTRSLGISMIATNVEEANELEMLLHVGISYAQGRFIAPISLLEEGK